MIAENYTRYNTEDLERLLKAAAAEKVGLYAHDWKNRSWKWMEVPASNPQLLQNIKSVHPFSGSRPGASSWRCWINGDDPCHFIQERVGAINEGKLLIRGEKALLSGKWGSFSEDNFLDDLGNKAVVSGNKGIGNRDLLADITRCWLLTALGTSYRASLQHGSGSKTLASVEISVKRTIERAGRGLDGPFRIRLLDSPPDKKPGKRGKKSTNAEKTRRLYSLYGRTTEDDRTLHGGGQTGTYQWEDRITKAMKYYHREWLRRENHRKKLIALGENPVPYETFGDYLRQVAEEWDNKNALLVLSLADWGEED